ncbi:MAG TPA: V-type ATPase 116kDa subunit family protein [Frankiaceae bacterium]|nr:V-type ATPase 116kDa subunit family protein [Frankiaceae bacterium]
MRWAERAEPARMQRIAIVSPQPALRRTLVEVADAGVVQLDPPDRDTVTPPEGDVGPAEAEIAGFVRSAVVRGQVAALAGWTPNLAVSELDARLGPGGGSVVPLPRPRGVDPPTLLRHAGLSRSFAPLVATYGTVPYADLDPTLLAGLAYVVMFGVMFADTGHGALLLLAGLLLRSGRIRRARRLRPVWAFVAGAGLASMMAGLLYGEFFGPTHVVPVLWLSPLDHPVPLLLAGVGLGAVLLAVAYGVGVANRVREGGWPLALYAPSGLAGAGLFLALGLIAGGAYGDLPVVIWIGSLLAVAALGLAFIGFLAVAGGGGAGASEAFVEMVDLVMRLGSNVVSFARLAAFGLTHAALSLLVWDGTTGLWRRGGVAAALALVVFVVGNAVTFTLEAVVAGIQALRLEYYELFSRVFAGQGRPFEPWHIPLVDEEST